MAEVDRGDTLEVDVLDTPETPETTPEVAPEAALETSQEPEGKASESEGKAEPENKERDEKGRFIPTSRHKQILENERAGREAAERKLAELQASLKQIDRNADTEKLEAEIVGLEKQHSKLLLDGDHEKAAELMTQIRLKERTIAIQQATHLSERAKNDAREEVRMDTAIATLETTYEELNPESEKFDQDLVDFVLGTQQSLITSERLSPSAALLKAAQKVMAKLGARAEPDTSKGLAAGKVAQDRKQAQVEKNVETAKRQPPTMKEVGIDSDKAGVTAKVDYTKLTAEEREALPAATRARLRGDELE